MPSWFNDFEIKDRTILVKATGARLHARLGNCARSSILVSIFHRGEV